MRKGLVVTALALLGLANAAHATDPYTLAAMMGAAANPGLAPGGIPGTIIDYDDSGYQLTPYETAVSGYDYTVPSPLGITAGELRDFHWTHEQSGAFVDPQFGTKWLFAGVAGTEFVVDPAVDHEPVAEEGLETTLWGSFDGGATWIPSLIREIYVEGWDPSSIEDQPSARYVFAQPVSLISATAGLQQGQYLNASTDTEIDAVLLVPEPASLGLLAVAALGLRRRS